MSEAKEQRMELQNKGMMQQRTGILVEEDKGIFRLDTPETSYVMGLADGKYLGHVYYGPKLVWPENGIKLEDTVPGYMLRREEPPFTPDTNGREKGGFFDTFPAEFSYDGTGDFRESCLNIRDQNGQEGMELVYAGYVIAEGKPALKGLPATWGDSCQTLVIKLEDREAGRTVCLLYTAFSDVDVITRSVRIKNNSDSDLYLTRALSACMDMDDRNFELLTLHGSWARERHMQRTPLLYGSMAAESTRGISSHQANPFFALVSKGCTQTRGEVYAMHFVYSGNFLASVQKNQYDQVRMAMGIHPAHFQWKLEPGEMFQTPEVVMTYSAEGLGKMTRTLHSLYRNHLIRSTWKDKRRPVLINNWEATYFDFNTEKLLQIAREAAKDGIEMLVMDDGWFGHRESDNSSLGDWEVNEKKITGGIRRLVDEVNKLGMQFGIWFEPEMISPDSILYRKHPDWVLQTKQRKPVLIREQYVLDLARPEVKEYVFQCLSKVLHEANISYVKWDMNRPIVDLGSVYLHADQQGELLHRHMLAVYELQERLLQEFPDLLLENCTSGGERFDPGMLYYSPQIWCSDDTDAVERLMIQEGTQLLYPLSCIGAHVSDCPNHIVGRTTSFASRGVVALGGTFGYELDITRIAETDRSCIPGQVALYKKYQPLIREGNYYRLASYQENHSFDCYEIVSTDRERALVVYVQVTGEPNQKSRMLPLGGLKERGLYRVEEIAIPGEKPDEEAADTYANAAYTGNLLMQAGLRIMRPWGDCKAKCFELQLLK